MADVESLEKLLASGRDSALLRFSLGAEYSKRAEFAQASEHLQRAVALDPSYSAAWKLLGKAAFANGQRDLARDAYTKGIAAAEAKGDKQAAKEMRVFLRRIDKPAQ